MPTENKPAEPLNVERSTVTKLVITGAPSLDPITVFLEDLAPKRGKITVSCWGKSWTAYWGGMWDGHTIAGLLRVKHQLHHRLLRSDHQVAPVQR